MDKLFTLYRYLATNQDNNDPKNRYTIAYRALESFLDIVGELEYWGKQIQNRGGLDWNEADNVTQQLTEGCKAALCTIFETPVTAIHAFTGSHVGLSDYDTLIKLIEQTREETKKLCEEDALGDLDDLSLLGR